MIVRLSAAVVFAALALPAAANANTARFADGAITVTANAGQATSYLVNATPTGFTINSPAGFAVDPSAAVVCTLGIAPTELRCARTGVDAVTIDAGDGADTITVEQDIGIPLTAIGGPGDDKFFGSPGDDEYLGGSGNDEGVGNLGDDALDGGTGNDRLWGDAVEEEAKTGGKDLLTGGAGRDSIVGGPQLDDISGGSSGDRIEPGKDKRRDDVDCGSGRQDLIVNPDFKARTRTFLFKDGLLNCEQVEVPRYAGISVCKTKSRKTTCKYDPEREAVDPTAKRALRLVP